MNRLGHDRTHVVHFQQFFDRRVHDRIERAEMLGQILRRRFADMANAERVKETRERGVLGLFERVQQVLRGLFGETVELGERRKAEVEQIGRRAHEILFDQLVDDLFAEPVDIERTALREVPQRLLALRRTEQATGAAGDRLVRQAFDGRAAYRDTAWASRTRAASAGRRSMSAPTTSGITSPARRTITVSPMRMSLRRTSSSLCSVAFVTVAPPTNTGSRRATGVIAPVRPTCTSIASSFVSASCAGKFMRQREARRARHEAERVLLVARR